MGAQSGYGGAQHEPRNIRPSLPDRWARDRFGLGQVRGPGVSSFKGNGKRNPKNNPYDTVVQDGSMSAGAKLIWIIMAARGTPRTEDQILQDLDDLTSLLYEAQNDPRNQ